MKIIFSLLILLSISFNTQANHEKTLELDGFTILEDRIILKIYNKTQEKIYPSDYLWTIGFNDTADRKYIAYGAMCPAYSDCDWFIQLNRKGFSFQGQAHDD